MKKVYICSPYRATDSAYGKNSKSIAIFRSLWADYKELQRHKELAKKESGLLAQIKSIKRKRTAQRL